MPQRSELEQALITAHHAGRTEEAARLYQQLEASQVAVAPQPSARASEAPLTEAERERSGMGMRFAAGVAEGTGFPAAAELMGPAGAKEWINQYQRDRAEGIRKQDIGMDLAGGMGQAVGFLGTGMGLGAATKGSAAAARVADAIAGSKFRQYVAGGALAGAMTPMEHEGDAPWTTKAEQVATGAAVGAVAKPVVAGLTGAGSWVGRKTGELVNAYGREPQRAAGRVIREVGTTLASPEERRLVADALDAATRDPRYAGMTSEQILREQGLGATAVKLLESQRVAEGPQHVAYVAQERQLLGAPKTWLEGVRGAEDFLQQEAADKAALSAAFESAKTTTVLLNIKPVIAQLNTLLKPTTSKITKVVPSTGEPLPSAQGQAIMTEGENILSPKFRTELRDIHARLYETDPPKQVMERMQRLAESEIPESGNIQVKGYAKKLRTAISAIGKADDLAPIQSQLDALTKTIKDAGFGADGIGRAAKHLSQAVKAGPTRLTDNPATILNMRTQILQQAEENPHAFEAGKLRDLVHLIDAAAAKKIPELETAMAQRVAAGEQLGRRKVAGALVRAMHDPRGKPTPGHVLAAYADPDFVQSVTKGVQPATETLGKYFAPHELQQLERMARVNRGVGGSVPKVTTSGAETVAGRIETPSPHFLSKATTILSQAGKIGGKHLEGPIREVLLQGQLNPAQLATLLRDIPVSPARQRLIDAITNQALAQTGRTATARAVADQY